jgi:hypothetical protein
VQRSIGVSDPDETKSRQPHHQLMNTLKGDAQLGSEFGSTPWPYKESEKAIGRSARPNLAVAIATAPPSGVWHDRNRSRFSARREKPFTVTLFDEASSGETAERHVGLLEIEPRAQSNAGLCVGSRADRFEACRLRRTQVY